MAEQKTKPTAESVDAFIDGVENVTRREDARTLLALMREVTGEEPRMWGPSMIGFGEYHYRYDSGHEGNSFRTGFSPRKTELSLYVMPGVGKYEHLLARLGRHRTGVSCLYVRRLADVDMAVLRELVEAGWADMQRRYR
jgi:hypothetical protein